MSNKNNNNQIFGKESGNTFYVYTDGSCKGNPGIGGWAFLILDENGKEISHDCDCYYDTTNNRMEMNAVIESLKRFNFNDELEIYIYSDSAYIVNCFKEDWLSKWKRKNWVNSQKKEVLNKDLWQEIDNLVSNRSVYFEKVKGHSNNKYNNKVDHLAQKVAYDYKNKH